MIIMLIFVTNVSLSAGLVPGLPRHERICGDRSGFSLNEGDEIWGENYR
jgi:hypothetical protein